MSFGAVDTKYDEHERLILNLKDVVVASMNRVMQEQPDQLFFDNVNFFTKAYLVSLCTNLEAYLQDVAYAHVSRVQERLASAKVPNNVIRWALFKDVKKEDLRFVDFSLSTTRKDLGDELSGNPGKTITLFRHIGIDLQVSDEFKSYKDVIGAVVNKRNAVIHHNDNAADISLADLLTYADQFLLYMKSIRDCVSNAYIYD